MPKNARMEIKTVKAKHGLMSYYEGDQYVGRSLEVYGEFAENEVLVFNKVLKPGDVALDCGAQIGALTIPMARLVGPTGKVYAFEPGHDNLKLLNRNVEQNELFDVVQIVPFALSDKVGNVLPISNNPSPFYPKVNREGDKSDGVVHTTTIDDMQLEKLKFMKVDVDGCEQELLDGAYHTIKRCRPIIYIENEVPEKSEKLIATITDHRYRSYWFRPPLYTFPNFNLVSKNVFPHNVASMMVCVPEESGFEVKGCDEVQDIRMDDQMFDREIARYSRIVAEFPDDLTSRLKIAHYHALMHRMGNADRLMQKNLRMDPKHIPTLAIEGLHMLQRGEWKKGWERYELRYQQGNTQSFGGHRKPRHLKMWMGEKTEEPLLIWCEQGFGDSIMFARFYKFVKERAPNAILEVQPELYELFEHSKVEPTGQLYRLGRELPDQFGLQCSLPSLPYALGADEKMMDMKRPYLFPDPVLKGRWDKLGMKIGICNVGSPRSERPYTRDIAIEMFRDIELAHGPFMDLVDRGQFESYAMTAAAISALDLVITVDTSIAHLAGAMGKPTWLLLAWDPDFRWGLKGDGCIWYPTMRIFRQKKFRDWAGVMEKVSAALDKQVPVSNVA